MILFLPTTTLVIQLVNSLDSRRLCRKEGTLLRPTPQSSKAQSLISPEWILSKYSLYNSVNESIKKEEKRKRKQKRGWWVKRCRLMKIFKHLRLW
jgi:hypothetical protein